MTEDLKKIDVPTLILHGDDDQIVPIDNSAKLSVKLIKKAELKIYTGGSHGMCTTEKNKVNADLLAFSRVRPAEQATIAWSWRPTTRRARGWCRNG